jgi:hypothetical protein
VSNKSICFLPVLFLMLLFGCTRFIGIFFALILSILVNFYDIMAILALVYVVFSVFFKKGKRSGNCNYYMFD